MKISVADRSFLYILKLAVAIIALMSFFGCSAYLNTLYNGKNAFKEARLLHQKKAKNYPDSLLVSAPADATAKYERAVQKSIKVMDAFPKKKKWHDDALILMGKSYYYKKDFQKAIRKFKDIQKEFPLSKFVPESYVYMAMCYIEDGSYDKAEESLEIVLNKYPQLVDKQQITLLLVEIAIRREGRSEAIVLLEKSLKEAKTDQKRVEIIIRISQLYIDMKQYQKALPLLQSAPRKKNSPEQSYRLDKNQTICLRAIGKLDDALKLISAMASSRLYEAHKDEIVYEKGLILKALTKYDDAIDVFKWLCKDADTVKLKNDTSTFKGKAYYELGIIYQLLKGDYKKAQEYFALASGSTDTTVRRNASRRVVAMKTLDSLRNIKTNKTDSQSVRDKRLIMISELFRFDLEEPDSACNEYLKIVNDTAVSKETGAKALCAAAIVIRDNKRDSIRSDSLFRSVIKKFPDTEYAQLAQKELKIAVTIETRQDSALAAYRKAELLFYNDNDVKGAIRSFFDIYKTYPEQDIAPKSLYAAAWFSDNVLQKKSTAKGLYEKLCEKYKTSVYCKGADLRVKTVKDTLIVLNELRKKNEKRKIKESRTKASVKGVKDSVSAVDTVKLKNSDTADTDLFSGDDEEGGNVLPNEPSDSTAVDTSSATKGSQTSPVNQRR